MLLAHIGGLPVEEFIPSGLAAVFAARMWVTHPHRPHRRRGPKA